jgi:hypothetical protein
LLIVLAELVLLGSGRMLQIGPLTLRMWFYALCLTCAVLLIIRQARIDREIMLLGLGFVALTAVTATVGLIHHARLEQVATDIKPLLFFPMVFFFAAAIQTVEQTRWIATLIRACSLLLAIGYLSIWILVFLKVLPFSFVYAAVSRTGEFFFRGESGTFYKGFLYLGVGFCFFLGGGWRSRLAAVVLLIAIALTFTRGLLLAAVLTMIAAGLLRERGTTRLPWYGAILVGGIAAAWPWLVRAFADRAASDTARAFDMHVVQRSATWSSFLIGHGLGKSVGDQAQIEESYLQIIHQQGIVGLLFWLSIAVLLTRDFWRATYRGRQAEALPFYLAALFVFFESATNPFLTNPIGMSVVLVALVVLKLFATADLAAPMDGATVTPPPRA